jgi:hypothetical protein
MTENKNEEKTKAFELRELTADDMFPMIQIISKIGIREFKSCFESDNVKKLVAEMTSGKASKDELKATVGVTVAFDLASVILSNLANCKDDIYLLLSQLSGMTAKEIAKLPMMTFVEMIIEVIKKKEFADFFQAAVKLFK